MLRATLCALRQKEKKKKTLRPQNRVQKKSCTLVPWFLDSTLICTDIEAISLPRDQCRYKIDDLLIEMYMPRDGNICEYFVFMKQNVEFFIWIR